MTKIESWDTYIRNEDGTKINIDQYDEQEIIFNNKCNFKTDHIKQIENLKMKMDNGKINLRNY